MCYFKLSMKLSVAAAMFLFASSIAIFGENKADKGLQTLFIGTYTGPKSEGIYSMQFNPENGKLSALSVAAKIESPSFLALDIPGKKLFCVNEVANFKGEKAGGISSFTLTADGKLDLINQESSVGTGPCHLSLSKDRTHLIAVNYGGGSTCMLPIDPMGKLSKASDFIQHQGSRMIKGKLEIPHAHSVQISADGKYAVIADLGFDKIFIHEIDTKSGKLTPFKVPFIETAPGAGPRHLAFHPSGKFLFVVNESNSTVTAFRWAPETSDFKNLASASTLPKDFKGNNSTAEIIVHPNGKTIYASNRGHNSICVFNFDSEKETLNATGHGAEKINTPRNFTLHPSGKWLLVGNQASNSIAVYKVGTDGALSFSELFQDIPNPVCLRFWIQ
ncbi:MAG: lactonase family protein [Planctomycetes bacterium]|nr:lactonase family protein [Planctomycetota bacterium]NBY02114.1 lactonase family protein [Planctomycetota bacterium]